MIDEVDHTDALVVRVGRPEAVAVFFRNTAVPVTTMLSQSDLQTLGSWPSSRGFL
jgi:hypothetical protein